LAQNSFVIEGYTTPHLRFDAEGDA